MLRFPAPRVLVNPRAELAMTGGDDVARARTGDTAAFERLYRTHAGRASWRCASASPVTGLRLTS
ncbi:MAG: hypothetical protein FJ202_01925 [Gemmatimonadetes bacterium]|nr:hypothetical protein [Gemmatimonadota bacterium]